MHAICGCRTRRQMRLGLSNRPNIFVVTHSLLRLHSIILSSWCTWACGFFAMGVSLKTSRKSDCWGLGLYVIGRLHVDKSKVFVYSLPESVLHWTQYCYQPLQFLNAQYTPLTPTRLSCRVESRRRCVLNSQLAHDDCRRIRSTIWKLDMLKIYPVELRRYW